MNADIYEKMAQIEDAHWWFVARRKIARRMLASLKLPAQAAILEAGCGTGGNFALLREFGSVHGMELDESARALALRRGPADVRAGRLPEAIPFDGARFDLVVLMDVLEHLEYDLESLRALRARLKPGGWIYATVPALPFLWSAHDTTHHHRRRYVAKSLRQITETAGFKIHFLSYYNTVLFPLAASVRLVDRLRGYDKAHLEIPPRPVNWLFEKLFASERHVVGAECALPVGMSLLMTAQNV
jgi:SAM-dependent methyltransferase